MKHYEQLDYGQFYHIYNHAVGDLDLFCNEKNYKYFLRLYDKYISPIAETYAWVLMKNHFHLLVRIRVDNVSKNLTGLKPLHQHFSNLFNAYTKAYNKYNEISGALFERPYKRKLIDNEEYLRQVVVYIHNNPVYHGFCRHPSEYPWSSYHTCTSGKPTKLMRDSVLSWFDGQKNFIKVHEQTIDWEPIEKILGM